jgi:hypothetical protein
VNALYKQSRRPQVLVCASAIGIYGFSTTPASIALATIFFLPGQLRLNLEACSVEFEDLTKPLFDGFQMFGRHLSYPPIESLLRQRP